MKKCIRHQALRSTACNTKLYDIRHGNVQERVYHMLTNLINVDEAEFSILGEGKSVRSKLPVEVQHLRVCNQSIHAALPNLVSVDCKPIPFQSRSCLI